MDTENNDFFNVEVDTIRELTQSQADVVAGGLKEATTFTTTTLIPGTEWTTFTTFTTVF